MPAERTAQLWVDRTPPDFTFDIKAHALMTGQGTETKRLPKSIREALPDEQQAKSRIYAKDLPRRAPATQVWRMFRDGLAPLAERGQLGSILLQYPKWVFPSSENRAQIDDAVERLDGWKVAVEFRNGSWLNEKNAERTSRFLAERNIPFVMVDEPQGFKSSVPPEVLVTSSDLALVRFHGRNADTWEKKGITPAERFRYLYSRDELSEWVPRIREVAKEAKEVHLMFNNCYANYGTTNAREIADLLAEELRRRRLSLARLVVGRRSGPRPVREPAPTRSISHSIVVPWTSSVNRMTPNVISWSSTAFGEVDRQRQRQRDGDGPAQAAPEQDVEPGDGHAAAVAGRGRSSRRRPEQAIDDDRSRRRGPRRRPTDPWERIEQAGPR